MKKYYILVFIFFVSTEIFSDVLSEKDEQVEKEATPLLENILQGLEKNDYQAYSRDFDDAMKEALPESKFATTQKQINSAFGKLKSKKYLGFLNKEKMSQVLWKGKFDKTGDDILILLVCSKRSGKIYITGLWFK